MIDSQTAGTAFHSGCATLYIAPHTTKEEVLTAFEKIRALMESFINDTEPASPVPSLSKLREFPPLTGNGP